MRFNGSPLLALATICAGVAHPTLATAATVPQAVIAQREAQVDGTVFNASTRQIISTATIIVRGRSSASSANRSASADSVTTTRSPVHPDGTFRVDGLRPGRYSLSVRALGFAPFDTSFSLPDTTTIHFGALTLTPVAASLGRVQVTGERDATTLSLDRNSYAVKDLPGASGGTALDALRAIPAVGVDADNVVSLRNSSNVVVQINGRPTPLRGQQLGNYLAQLAASRIASVEVATNPSARDDPDGAAGIINIVLARRTDLGTNGGYNAAAATSGLVNVSGNVGRQADDWAGVANYGVLRDGRPLSGSSQRFGQPDQLPQPSFSAISGRSGVLAQNGSLRGQYELSPRVTLSADANVSAGVFTRLSDAIDSRSELLDSTSIGYARHSDVRTENQTSDVAIAWQRSGRAAGNALSVELRRTDGRTLFENRFATQAFQADGTASASGSSAASRELTDGRVPTWRAQADWTRTFSNDSKLQLGTVGIDRNSTSDFSSAPLGGGASSANGSDAGATDDRSSAYAYREEITAAYGVLSHRKGSFDLQGGLRLEQFRAHFRLTAAAQELANDLIDTRDFYYSYRTGFPSAVIAYNLATGRQVKLSYSRRVNRLDPQQLNPVEYRESILNVFKGNPALTPEYADSYELGYQQAIRRGTVQLTSYARRTPNAVRFIRSLDSAGLTRGTYANVAHTTTYGTDLNLGLRMGKVTLNGAGSVFRNASDAHLVVPDLSFHAFGWNARANTTFRLSSLVDVQASANYNSPIVVEGGRILANGTTNFAVRKKLNADKSTLTLRVSDPFNTMAFGYRASDGRSAQTIIRRFGTRALTLNYSYNFGRPPKLRERPEDASTPPPGGGPQ